ncbi:MAG: GNAT family N-acetyltransferase [Mycobacteriales bacterium]
MPVLRHGPLTLRALRRRDASTWVQTRLDNEDWLARWEALPPDQPYVSWADRHTTPGFLHLLRTQRAAVRAGTAVPFAIFWDDDLCGQVNVGNLVRGAFNSAYLGYWVSRAVAGRGVMPTAVALVADYCFQGAGLHRLEANIRPENAASVRVAEKCGFTAEGMRRRYLAIDGDYRDHVGYVLLAEDLPGGVLSALVANGDALRT